MTNPPKCGPMLVTFSSVGKILLKEQDIDALRKGGRRWGNLYSTTAHYWDGSLSHQDLKALAKGTGRAKEVIDNSRICIVYGYGSQPTSTYRELATLHGLEIVWDQNFGPWWLFPFTLVVASRGGLIRILELEVIEKVLLRLARLAMVELFSFSSELYPELL